MNRPSDAEPTDPLDLIVTLVALDPDRADAAPSLRLAVELMDAAVRRDDDAIDRLRGCALFHELSWAAAMLANCLGIVMTDRYGDQGARELVGECLKRLPA